jgi:glycosyltransferase involved in cell wall biosynthesis
MDTPLVSIIIPTYNRAHLIGETLDSVLAQTYTNWECIVVDDGSTDTTAELLADYCKKDSRFQYHHRPTDRPKGANACRNYGFELSKGEYINWFDDDDLMLEEFILIKMNIILENKVKLVFCSGYITDSNFNILRETNYYNRGNLFKTYSLEKSEILTPSILVNKFFLNEIELFNTNLTRGQETDFFYRLLFKLNESDYIYSNDKLFLYKQHQKSVTSKNNDSYLIKNRWSLSYISIENLKRGFYLKDAEIINNSYLRILKLLFDAIDFKDKETIRYILNRLVKYFFTKNFKKIILINAYIKFSMIANRRSYRIEKYLRSINLTYH